MENKADTDKIVSEILDIFAREQLSMWQVDGVMEGLAFEVKSRAVVTKNTD